MTLALPMYRKHFSENTRSHCNIPNLGKMGLSKIFMVEMERKIYTRTKEELVGLQN